MTCLGNLNGSYNVQNNESDTDSAFVIKASPFQRLQSLHHDYCFPFAIGR